MFVFSLFFFQVIDALFTNPKNDGEEALILSFLSPVKRRELFISKILAFLACFAFYNFLTLVLPFGIRYFWEARDSMFLLGLKPSIVAFLLLSLTVIFLFPILLLLFPLSFYLSSSLWRKSQWIRGILRTTFSLKSFFSKIIEVSLLFSVPFYLLVFLEVKEIFNKLIFYAPFSLLVGSSLIFLCWYKYEREDL